MITDDERFIEIQAILAFSNVIPENCFKINDLIIELSKENQQLKDNWNKLKEWANNFYNSKEVGWAGCGMRYTLEKILELEGSDSNE